MYDLDGTRQIKKEDAVRAITNMGYTLSKEEVVGLNNYTEGESLGFEHFKEICQFMLVTINVNENRLKEQW